jgi:hypothetical protein
MDCLEGRSLLSATSAVAWKVGPVIHDALYAIDKNDSVEVSVDGGTFTNMAFPAKQVSAGLDVFNKPEVYAIGFDNAVYVNDGAGFIRLNFYAKEISATVENTAYAIGLNDDVFVRDGSVFVDTGLKVRQISAGADSIGNPRVYAIGFDNHVYVGNGSGGVSGFANWGGYAKQLSATVDSTVYAIGSDNAVYKDSGSGSGTGWVSLGGYAKQISAGIDAAFGPFVFAIGLNDGLWSNHGLGWVSFGGYVTDVAGPSIGNFGVSLPTDLAYVVAKGHGAFLHKGTIFTPVGGYVLTPSGSAVNNTNTWAAAARDVSAVSWVGPFGLTHHAVYAISPLDTVQVSFAGSPFISLGGYAKQISAGLDATGSPEVYAIGADNAVWVNRGSAWVRLGGYFKEISATLANTVYAIGTDDAVWVNHGSGWLSLGGYAKQISAGADAAGNPEVFAIGGNDAVFVKDGSWVSLGGYAKQISATMHNAVYAIGGDNAVYEDTGSGFVFRSGYVKQISASLDAAGNPEVFGIGTDDALYVNHGLGFVKLGPNYVTEISAPAVDVGFLGDLAYAVGKGHVGLLHKGGFVVIAGGTIE